MIHHRSAIFGFLGRLVRISAKGNDYNKNFAPIIIIKVFNSHEKLYENDQGLAHTISVF